MHNGIAVAIVEGAEDLSSKFSSVFFSEFAVTDDVVEHLSAVDILEKEIKVSLGDDDISHATYIWMS
jgi:hypothetical protein